MKLLFEGYQYEQSLVKHLIDNRLYIDNGRSKMQIPFVGYYYSISGGIESDSVFILPKVFIDSKGNAFGRYNPSDIIDLNDDKNPLDDGAKKFIFGLSVWIYRAISQFNKRNIDNDIKRNENVQNVVSTHGDDSDTFLDTILSLLKFHKEHRNLFTYISIINSTGNNKISWNKTIRHKQPYIKNNIPVYFDFFNKDKTINFDEEIIVLFYSVLNYLNKTYFFKVKSDIGYDIFSARKVESMINSCKGTRLLKQIRKKYFTDELVALWKLLYVFFDKSERIANKRYHEETLLSKNFNIIFEDMIEKLIGEDKRVPNELKNQLDGKIVDHIYLDESLIKGTDIYFVGDSKYYKEENEVGVGSIYKQFTYAKNVIQYNIDIYDSDSEKANDAKIRYRDELTEGYNITPNFFIRGVIDSFDSMTYSEIGLKQKYEDGRLQQNHQFKNRLFDRDTLILQTYNINFLFVLSAYACDCCDNSLKQEIRKQFRDDLLLTFNNKYDFYILRPHQNEDLETLIDKYFRRLIGKIIRPSNDSEMLVMALEKGASENGELLKLVECDFCTPEKFELGDDCPWM